MEAAGRVWADAKNAAALLEKTKDSVFAQLVLDAREGATKISRREAELRAWGGTCYGVP